MSHIWLSESGKSSGKKYESKTEEIREKVFRGKEPPKDMEVGSLEPTWGFILVAWSTAIHNMEKVEGQLERQVGASSRKF